MLGRKPMIQHVYEQAAACRAVSEVLVATDDERIKQTVEEFGGQAVLITGDYRTGTDRVAGVARSRRGRFFLNLQGDEIPLDPELLTDLIEPFVECGAEMGTLKRAMHHRRGSAQSRGRQGGHRPAGPGLVFFTRADPVGARRSQSTGREGVALYPPGRLHLYDETRCSSWRRLPTGGLEDAEKLEQLRALDHGIAHSGVGNHSMPPCASIRRRMSSLGD